MLLFVFILCLTVFVLSSYCMQLRGKLQITTSACADWRRCYIQQANRADSYFRMLTTNLHEADEESSKEEQEKDSADEEIDEDEVTPVK